MTKHTPRPWHSKHWHGGEHGTHYTIHDAQGNKIADFVHPDAVNVMTAAPEMLDSLEAIVSLCKNACAIQGHSFAHYKECQIAETIIAKAKGQQK